MNDQCGYGGPPGENCLEATWHWFTDPVNWTGMDGLPTRLGEHLYYAGLALLVALVVAVPLGLFIGHTNRGGFLVVNLSNAARALPTLGLVYLIAVVTAGIGDLEPLLIPLALLAVPPVLVNTYEGIRQVEPELVDAARCLGLREFQVLRQVELPIALPLVMTGIRVAAVQVMSTATIAAFITLGGLGVFIRDGLKQQNFPMMIGGATVVVLLALLTEAFFHGAQRVLVSSGVRGR